MLGILGKKIGMTQIFVDGIATPVTVLEATTNYVLQKKTEEKEGYNAIQIGCEEKKEKHTSKPMMGVFKKAGVNPLRFIKEFKIDNLDDFELGQEIKVSLLDGVEFVDVTGTSKGKGNAGVMKRHNFSGNRATHGVSRNHRRGGSIGQSSTPSKVLKGTRMPGRLGGDQVTVQNLKLVKTDLENNLILIKGAVPGAKNSFVVVKPALKK